MPFFEATNNSEVSGGNFTDVKGDLNGHDYSIQTSGQDNMVTQINRPAMIHNGEGGQVTIHIHSNWGQDHLGFPGNAYPGHPMFPRPYSDHPMAHSQQPTSQPADYQSDISSARSHQNGSFYAPAPPSPPVMMPTPSLPFTPSPPPKAQALPGTGMPSASDDDIPFSPATPYQNLSQERTPNEPQPGFFQPAFRISVPDTGPGTHSSPSSDQIRGPEHYSSTMSPQHPIDSRFVPLPPSPQHDGGPHSPAEPRSLKHVPNTRPPSRSFSANQSLMPQHDNVPTPFNQNVGRRPMTPEHRWTIFSTFPSEKEFRGAHETGSFFESMPIPIEPSQSKETNQEELSELDIFSPREKKKNAGRTTDIIVGKQWN